MNHGRVILSLSLVLLAACQKAAVSTEDTGTFQTSSVNCVGDSSDPSLKIVGKSAAQSGSAIGYSLSDAGRCVDGQDVAWKAAGSTRVTPAGLTSVYRKAGVYVVTAQEKSSSAPTVSIKTAVVSSAMALSGPQAGFKFNDISFSLIVPASMTATNVQWNFGDNSAVVKDTLNVTHMYYDVGEYKVTVSAVDGDGKAVSIAQRITVIELVDGMDCLSELAISGPTEAKVGVATSMSAFIPACLTSKVGAVRWNFGDGQADANQTVSHVYNAEGSYAVTATLYLGSSQTPWITLDHSVNVTKDLPVDPDPEIPVDPNSCKVQGETRESQGDLYSETIACGIDGTKTNTYRDRVVEECKLVVESLKWVETTRTKDLTNEGACQGQSCKLPDGSSLANGATKVLYTNSTPAGTCASVSESRTCNNGVLSGNSSANQLVCHEGCGNFGAHGTVKTGIVIGEVKVPLTCQYGEQGFFDIFNQVTDQACVDGAVIDSNTRQGSIKTAGACPVYNYVGTDNYTTCSADCGGSQTRIFECRDNQGNVVDKERCGNVTMQVELRQCDGNPAAVRRQESSTVTEEANSSKSCPKNQIGVIAKTRDVVTVKTYACIDHSVQLESTVATPTAWVEESFCRDYVARRCSQDSLSNSQAKGRYDWMVKCQDRLPIVKDFLENFGDVKVSVGGTQVSVGANGRELYPTFMNTAYKPEKPWIAPVVKTADCVMPETAYVATVCVSSCATPEQQILAQERANGSLKYVPFIEALTKKMAFVASLKNANSMRSGEVNKTLVDQWVTELIDTEHVILVFKMKSGRELRITPNHPVLQASGAMKTAAEFKAGEDLVQLGGKLDPIVSITSTKYFGKVYNVFVQSSDVAKNILVTNGYLNGSAYFQNAGAKDMNRALFKLQLTRGVFEK